MDNIETTQGTKVDDWGNAYDATGAEKTEGFIEKEARGGSVASDVMKYGAKFLKDLESNLPFTVMLVSIIGYIVIASFGQMDSVRKYFGYLLFLFLMFCGYKALKIDFLKIIGEKINKIIWIIVIILVLFIIFQNFSLISYFFNKVKL